MIWDTLLGHAGPPKVAFSSLFDQWSNVHLIVAEGQRPVQTLRNLLAFKMRGLNPPIPPAGPALQSFWGFGQLLHRGVLERVLFGRKASAGAPHGPDAPSELPPHVCQVWGVWDTLLGHAGPPKVAIPRLFDDVVDQRIEIRRREMNIALTWCAVLLLGFALVTLDVINKGLLYRFDQFVADLSRPKLSGFYFYLIISLSVPDHREVAKGTLRSLIRTAGITLQEFVSGMR